MKYDENRPIKADKHLPEGVADRLPDGVTDETERREFFMREAIKLAKSLDMLTVAEGVEEKPQVDFLAEQGCDMIQGYYFAKPMPKSDYAEKMSRTAYTEQPALPEQTE